METETTRDLGRHAPSTSEVIEGLNDLLQLDHDAINAYEIAIQKLEDRDHADQIAGFQRDHERHVRELNELIARLGGTPVNEPHRTGPFKEALQSLGGLAGDRGVLIAWRTNEVLTRTKYDSYASKATFWPDDVKRVIDQNALDEERHVEWATGVLQGMGVPTAEGLESGVATRLREAGTQAEGMVNRVRDRADDLVDATRERAGELADATRQRAGELAESARNRVASGIDAAADRLEDATTGSDVAGGRVERVGQGVAGGMHTGARYLRDADVERVRTDLERSAQQHPLRTLSVLFAVGFVIGRLLR